jgi:ribosomal protein L37AE/L43A
MSVRSAVRISLPPIGLNISDHCIRHVWSCEACGYQFEDTVYLSGREMADTS